MLKRTNIQFAFLARNDFISPPRYRTQSKRMIKLYVDVRKKDTDSNF